MTFLAGRINAVFEKIKYLFNRLNQKFEGNLAKSEDLLDYQDLERTRKKLVQMRFRNEGADTESVSESRGAFAMESVRRRMTSEIETTGLNARVKNRQAVNKWFFKDGQCESGAFNAVDFDKRLKEAWYEQDEVPLSPLPAVEDTFMAFSRSDDNLFDEEPISLSGLHYKVDPLEYEDFDEAYSMPAIASVPGEIDFTPTTSFAPEEGNQDEAREITASNPMVKVLSELEERMSANQLRRDGYWVD